MTEQEALARAQRAAIEAGHILDDYGPPNALYYDDGWSVSYHQKPPRRPGGHFTVVVGESGKTRLIAGR